MTFLSVEFGLQADPLTQVFAYLLCLSLRLHLRGETRQQHLQDAVDEVLIHGHVGTSSEVVSKALVPDNNRRFRTFPAGALGLLRGFLRLNLRAGVRAAALTTSYAKPLSR